MSTTAGVKSLRLVHRIIAAEVAMVDGCASAACLFLARVPMAALRRANGGVRSRYLRVAKAARAAVAV